MAIKLQLQAQRKNLETSHCTSLPVEFSPFCSSLHHLERLNYVPKEQRSLLA